MADVICSICAEPIDLYEFHDIAKSRGLTFQEVYDDFRRVGCEAVTWDETPGRHNELALDSEFYASESVEPMAPRERAFIAGEIMDLLGDDIDGASALLEDFGLL